MTFWFNEIITGPIVGETYIRKWNNFMLASSAVFYCNVWNVWVQKLWKLTQFNFVFTYKIDYITKFCTDSTPISSVLHTQLVTIFYLKHPKWKKIELCFCGLLEMVSLFISVVYDEDWLPCNILYTWISWIYGVNHCGRGYYWPGWPPRRSGISDKHRFWKSRLILYLSLHYFAATSFY